MEPAEQVTHAISNDGEYRPTSHPVHVAAVKVPARHDDGPDTVYPAVHTGWHVLPEASELLQSPTPPFIGATDASHGSGRHMAAVSVPAKQDDGPDTEKPGSQLGWHVDPDASVKKPSNSNESNDPDPDSDATPPQSPRVPFKGGVETSQGSASHTAEVSTPSRHNDGPDTVYPASQEFRHSAPESSSPVQVPMLPLSGGS